MGTNVFINNDEACSRAANGKSAACFPDPCWSPPSPPAGPIVLPYPNTATAKSLKNGTTSVFVKRTPVALEDKSYFSTSTGNEAATQAFGKGVVSHDIKGKAYFVRWSQNVKFQGKGICRHGDLMTQNHGSQVGNTLVNQYFDSVEEKGNHCSGERSNMDRECGTGGATPAERKANLENWKEHCLKGWNAYPVDGVDADKFMQDINANECLKARRCRLVPYNEVGRKGPTENDEWKSGCCPGQTGHHLIPQAMINGSINSWPEYNGGDAPTMCVEGKNNSWGGHGLIHFYLELNLAKNKLFTKDGMISFAQAKCQAIGAAMKLYSHCSEKCLVAQLDAYYGADVDERSVTAKSGMPHSGTETAASRAQSKTNEFESRDLFDTQFLSP